MELRKELKMTILKHKEILFVNILLTCILSLSGPFSLYSQAYFIDQVEKAIQAGIKVSSLFMPTILLFLSFLLPSLSIVIRYITMKYEYSIGVSWNRQMNEIIKKIPYHQYEYEETYNKTKFIGENNYFSALISCIFSSVAVVVSVLFYVIILIRVSVLLTISVMLIAPAVMFFSSNIADKQYKKTYEINCDRRRGIYKSSLLRAREFSKEIRLNRCADYMIKDWEEVQKSIDSEVLATRFRYGLLSAIVAKAEYIVILINLLVVLVAYLHGSITVGIFVSISNQVFSMKIFPKIQNLVSQIIKTRRLRKSYLELLDFATKDETNQNANYNDYDSVTIEFKNVSFKYPKQEEFVLRNINLQMRTGETVAIVGENGAGKSTLIKLLLGLYIPDEGEILINNKNLEQYSLQEKSKIFGVAFQDYAKFCLSIKENITLGEDEEDWIYKAKYFEIDKFAERLRDGYDTLLSKSFGEAVDLSGGQWQTISLMRALIGDKNILVFDEPTASLDPIKEVKTFEKINTVVHNKLSIFITHRLGFTTKVDRILLIKNNTIVEDGSFKELISKNGEFKKMFELQKKLYIGEKGYDGSHFKDRK